MLSGPILIADDNSAIRDILVEALAAAGYTVITAEDGQEALDLAHLAQPSLVLLDLNMPVVSGFAFGEAANKRGLSIPILLVTADPRAAELVFDEQVVGIIPKPFDLDAVVDVVSQVLSRAT